MSASVVPSDSRDVPSTISPGPSRTEKRSAADGVPVCVQLDDEERRLSRAHAIGVLPLAEHENFVAGDPDFAIGDHCDLTSER